MGDSGEEFAASHFEFCQLLVSLRQLTSFYTQVFDGQIVIFAQSPADFSDHGHGQSRTLFQRALKSLLINFQDS